MDKYELLGFLLQNLRDDHSSDEEDLGPAILRETTKIFELVVRHGYLTRDMFDLTGLDLDGSNNMYSSDERYWSYQTTNYPGSFVAFANDFEQWVTGRDPRDRLIDLIAMIKEYSYLSIEVYARRLSYVVKVGEGLTNFEKFSERLSIPRTQIRLPNAWVASKQKDQY